MSKQNIKLIYQGAEAKILLNADKNFIIKDRIKKSYRLPIIDEKIRKSRTKSEAKLLTKCSQIINCPKPFFIPDFQKIKMPFIEGKRLSDWLDKFSLEEAKTICIEVGKDVAKLHDNNIIHGDLTTSNMILSDNKIYFIDFGLGFHSHRVEDKAVDLHLLRQALEAKHFKAWQILFNAVIEGYKTSKNAEKTLKQLEKVEKRGRYKH